MLEAVALAERSRRIRARADVAGHREHHGLSGQSLGATYRPREPEMIAVQTRCTDPEQALGSEYLSLQT